MFRFFVFILGAFTISCSGSSSKQKVMVPISPIQFETVDLSGEVFFIGPEIDSLHAEVVAECDCCASDLAFINDSSFIFIVRCLEGDTYVKGNYLTFGDQLILRTNGEVVVSENTLSYSDIEIPTSYKASKDKVTYISYTLSTWKGKQFITYSKDDYIEYGIRTDESMRVFLKQFEDEKVLRDFLEK
ncbi:hypothetical protein D3C87_23260 [compost metagenome]